MTLTVADLLEEVKHGSGGKRASQFVTQLGIVNQAVSYFNTMHTWDSMIRPEVELATVADQDYIELPSDVRDVLAIHAIGGAFEWLKWVTPAEVTQLRARDLASYDYATGYYGAIERRVPATGGVPVLAVSIYPSPSAGVDPAFLLRYRALIPSVGTGTSSDREYLIVESFLEPLIRRLVRIFAKGIEEEDEGSLEQRLELLEQSTMLNRMKEQDGAMVPDIGELTGGAAERGQQDNLWWDTSVEAPS